MMAFPSVSLACVLLLAHGQRPELVGAAAIETWDEYTVGGMDVLSVTGSNDYEKVVILLHGGGGSGADWKYYWSEGWFGDMTGLK